MPESENTKLYTGTAIDPPTHVAPAEHGYAELDVTTNFSFLRGASHADELVFTAAGLGHRAMAVTDINTLAGVVRAHEAAKKVNGFRLIIGARLVFNDGSPEMLVWPTDRAAYARLCRLITLGRRRAPKGECHITINDFLDHSEGMLAAVSAEWISGGGDSKTTDSPISRRPLRHSPVQLSPPSQDFSPPRRGDAEKKIQTDCTESTSETGLAEVRTSLRLVGEEPSAMDLLCHRLRDALGDRLSLAIYLCGSDDDQSRLESAVDLSRRTRIPLLATNHVHYHDPGRRPLQDVLTCVRHGCTISEAGMKLFPNAERHLKSPQRMGRLFSRCPQAIARGLEIAERCRFSLDELRHDYPTEVVPAGCSPSDHLRRLTYDGAADRYPEGVPESVVTLLEKELSFICHSKYESYFLTVHDLVRYARSVGILCQGRGSAANSAVCYCLGVTAVDPTKFQLVFERFASTARSEPPDIDIDFEHERREEVIQYVYQKYGRDRTAMTASLITYRGRSAVRDVGKALGFSQDTLDHLAGKLDWWHRGTLSPEQLRESGIDPSDPTIHHLVSITSELLGFPRHLSQHVGGMVISQTPLCEVVPIENAAMEDRTVIEWDKDDLDVLSIFKVDILALGMLTCISKSLAMINVLDSRGRKPRSSVLSNSLEMTSRPTTGQNVRRASARHDGPRRAEARPTSYAPGYERRLEMHTVPAEVPGVYEMICDADTIGVFQIESRAQMSMLPRLRPREFYDLVIEVAIVRPGPIQGDMVHPYLQRREALRDNPDFQIDYQKEELRDVLGKTLGVPLFQEQAMKIAMVAAAFSGAEADSLRRAMAAWKRSGGLHHFHDKFVNGMTGRGYTLDFAERCFKQICGFGEYGFPESHAASFAKLVYVSAWIKRFHPAAFAAGLINSQPMGFYAPAQIIRDAREHGVEVRPVDVNASNWDCTLEWDSKQAPCDTGFQPVRETNDLQTAQFTDQKSHARAGSPCHDGIFSEHKSRWGVGGPAIRLGFRLIKGMRQEDAERIAAARIRVGIFSSVAQLQHAAGISPVVIHKLAKADALNSIKLNRRHATWEAMALSNISAPLFDGLNPSSTPANLPPMREDDEVKVDYSTTGLSLKKHPVSFAREALTRLRVITAAELKDADRFPNGKWTSVAGLVLVRQRPGTASGVVFITLEDETGVANLILWSRTYERYRKVARHATLLQCSGIVQREGQVIHVLACRLIDRTEMLNGLSQASRDFH